MPLDPSRPADLLADQPAEGARSRPADAGGGLALPIWIMVIAAGLLWALLG